MAIPDVLMKAAYGYSVQLVVPWHFRNIGKRWRRGRFVVRSSALVFRTRRSQILAQSGVVGSIMGVLRIVGNWRDIRHPPAMLDMAAR